MNAIGLTLMSITIMRMMKVLVVPLKMMMYSQTLLKNQKPRVTTHFQIRTNRLTPIVLGHLGDKFLKQVQKLNLKETVDLEPVKQYLYFIIQPNILDNLDFDVMFIFIVLLVRGGRWGWMVPN